MFVQILPTTPNLRQPRRSYWWPRKLRKTERERKRPGEKTHPDHLSSLTRWRENRGFWKIVRGIGKCQNRKGSESSFCPFWKKLERVRIGKCQNWKESELESVWIGKCQNLKVSEFESVRIWKCRNRKVSEPSFCPLWKKFERVRIGKGQNRKVPEWESVRIRMCQNFQILWIWDKWCLGNQCVTHHGLGDFYWHKAYT